jgi:putative aldouronate transport system permease protein
MKTNATNLSKTIVTKPIGKKRDLRWVIKSVKSEYHLYLMFLPVIIYYVIFKYIPAIGSFVIGLTDYNIYKGILHSNFIGLSNFKEFLYSVYFWRLIRNTLAINFLNLFLAFPAPIIFALLLNEINIRPIKSIVQSISYLPHFISTVIIGSMLITFLSPSTGFINNIIAFFGGEKITFLQQPQYFWGIMTIESIWQGVGWGAIIYLAALTGVNTELYEAAIMDGAGKLRQAWHITLPGIAPTIVVMLLLRIGSLLEVGYELIILIYNPAIYSTSDVISSYVYRRGILEASYSFSTAVGLFQSVIGLLLVVGANKLAKKYSETSIW